MPDPAQYKMLYPPGPLPGAIVVDGSVAGVWRRRRRRFTVTPFPGTIIADLEDSITAAARALPLPGDPDETVIDWYGDL